MIDEARTFIQGIQGWGGRSLVSQMNLERYRREITKYHMTCISEASSDTDILSTALRPRSGNKALIFSISIPPGKTSAAKRRVQERVEQPHQRTATSNSKVGLFVTNSEPYLRPVKMTAIVQGAEDTMTDTRLVSITFLHPVCNCSRDIARGCTDEIRYAKLVSSPRPQPFR
jgi:hypothetical protein